MSEYGGERFRIGLVAFTLCLIMLIVSVGLVTGAFENFDIEIHVVDSEGAPYTNAQVAILDKEGEKRGSATTDDMGTVKLRVAVEGIHTIRVVSYDTGELLAMETMYLSPNVGEGNYTISISEVAGVDIGIRTYQMIGNILKESRLNLRLAIFTLFLSICMLFFPWLRCIKSNRNQKEPDMKYTRPWQVLIGVLVVLCIGVAVAMNYYSVSAITVTALATVTLAAITVYYAWSNHEILEITRINMERPQIVDLVKGVISSFIQQLEAQKSRLEMRNYTWIHYSEDDSRKKETGRLGYMAAIKKLEETNKLALGDFVRQHDKTAEKIEEYKERVSELNKRLSDLDGALIAPCRRKIKKYEKSLQKLPDSDELKLKYFVEWIINNTRKLGTPHDHYQFLEEYKDEFLAIKGRKGVKEYAERAEKTTLELLDISEDLITELAELLQRYRNKYKLTEEECRSALEGFLGV